VAAAATGTTGVAPDPALRFIYETDRGFLWYDADGTGKACHSAVIAQFVGHPALTAADIEFIA
jgi:hypothetical protein